MSESEGYRKLGEGRLVIGLPERYEKAKTAIADLESILILIQDAVAMRDRLNDAEILDYIESIFRERD